MTSLVDLLVNICVPMILILVGCGFIFWAFSTSLRRQQWQQRTGTVLGYWIDVKSDSEGTSYRAMVNFSCEIDGQTIQASEPLGVGSWSGPKGMAQNAIAQAERKSPVGGPIDLIVDPNNPSKVMPLAARGLDIVNVVLGIVFIASGLIWIGIAAVGIVKSILGR